MARDMKEIQTDIDEATAKRRRLHGELAEVTRAGLSREFKPGELERMERLEKGMTNAQEEIDRFKSEYRGAIAEGFQAGGILRTENGFGGGAPQTAAVARSGEVGEALRTIARANKAGLLPDGRAERATALVEQTSPLVDQSMVTRWVQAAGNEHYATAFTKLLGDPERGHLLWNADEQEAYRAAKVYGNVLRASMSTGANVGGELIPLTLDPSIMLTNDGTINPIRQHSRVVQTLTNQWRGITSAGATAEWKTQASQAAAGDPATAAVDIPLFLADCNVTYSYELAWSTVDLLGQLTIAMQDAIDRLEATAFTTGGGSTAPQGVITGLAGTASEINTVGSEVYVKADVYALQNALPARFSPRAQWYAHIAYLNATRQFETTNGNKEFPEMAQGQILGRAFNELSDMDGTTNVAATANNYVLLYGSLQQGYVIADRIGGFFEITTRLGANQRPTGERNATLWKMTGAEVVRPQALRLLDIPTTA